jgi:predicted ribosome quality control (RQC) complex YloA/Tae2 family protein
MPLDGIYLNRVKKELIPFIGGKVSKINQPSREEVFLVIRGMGLIISAAPKSTGVYLTKRTPDNPKTPYMFCMLLRKYLSGARLVGVEQDGFERVLNFDFENFDETGGCRHVRIAAELTGRSSNIVAVDTDTAGNGGDGRNWHIIDAVKRHGIPEKELLGGESTSRILLPNAVYEPPKVQPRPNIFELSESELAQTVTSAAAGTKEETLSKVLTAAFDGMSPLFARECALRCTGESDGTCENADFAKLKR